MKLLSEQINTDLLVEQKEAEDGSGKKHWFLEGVFLQANQKNRNGRIYPMNIMEPEVNRYVRDYVNKHRALGELGHPSGEGATSINFDNVTHIIEKIWRDGDFFKARAKILDTPKGLVVQELLKNNIQLGVSSRALGSVTKKDDADYVGEDFRIITAADLVYEPSANAFPSGIYESAEEYELDEKTGEYRMVAEKKEVTLTESEIKALSDKQKANFKQFIHTLTEKIG